MLSGIAFVLLSSAGPCQDQTPQFKYCSLTFPRVSKGDEAERKLHPSLQALIDKTKGRPTPKGDWQSPFGQRQTLAFFGASDGRLTLSVEAASSQDVPQGHGIEILGRSGPRVYLSLPVKELGYLATRSSIGRIDPVGQDRLHGSAIEVARLSRGRPLSFGPTGKGVAVAVIDSGIDWRHADFSDENGKTKILAIWDIFDDSFKSSNGKVGSQPPVTDSGEPIGTVYTSSQIDAALAGKGEVNTGDDLGHGTAVASTAAGSGRAAGSESASYQGVAPDARLIIVRAGKGNTLIGRYGLFCEWIADVASRHKLPVVVNISAGTQLSAHNGTQPEEEHLDRLIKEGKINAVTASAGNERQVQLHARSRFSARVPGSVNIMATPFQVEGVLEPEFEGVQSPLGLMYLDHRDDWGVIVAGTGLDAAKPNERAIAQIGKAGEKIGYALQGTNKLSDKQLDLLTEVFNVRPNKNGLDEVCLSLGDGQYWIAAFGNSETVQNGEAVFYATGDDMRVIRNGLSEGMVCSPASANNVIAVGAYYGRNTWPNPSGVTSNANVVLGAITDYSCPGFRVDKRVKPDFAAPGSYIVSAMAAGSAMAENAESGDKEFLAGNGKYLAWEGTSASSPYVAGMIARLLETDPGLQGERVRDKLKSMVIKDDHVGATPNNLWGYGKLKAE